MATHHPTHLSRLLSSSCSRLSPALCLVAFGALGLGCAAATPAARWDATERGQISSAFPKCELFEDEDTRSAGYACELGTFGAHDLDAAEDHAKASRRLAEEKAKQSFTAPLDEVVARDPITFGPDTFDASLATYRPAAGTILTPEVMMVLTSRAAENRRAYTCAVTLIAALDDKASIEGRVLACMKGLQLLVEASR